MVMVMVDVIVVMPPTPVVKVAADHRAAGGADHRADRAANHGATNAANDRAAERIGLGNARAAKSQQGAARHE